MHNLIDEKCIPQMGFDPGSSVFRTSALPIKLLGDLEKKMFARTDRWKSCINFAFWQLSFTQRFYFLTAHQTINNELVPWQKSVKYWALF